MAILRVRRFDGVWEEVPAIVGRKGDQGDPITVKNVVESNDDGGSNIITFSDDKSITIKNGNRGGKGDSATVNGVNALKIEGRDGIGATQNGDVLTLHLTGEGNEAGAVATILNRTTKVTEADTNYGTLMARGSAFYTSETVPTDRNNMVDGAIYWVYK